MKCPICQNETNEKICSNCGYSIEKDRQFHQISQYLSEEEQIQYQLQFNHYQKLYETTQYFQKQYNHLEKRIAALENNAIDDSEYYFDFHKAELLEEEDLLDYIDLLYGLMRNENYHLDSEYFLEMDPFPMGTELEKEIQRENIFSLWRNQMLVGCIRVQYAKMKIIIRNFYCDNRECAVEMIEQLKKWLNNDHIKIQASCHFSNYGMIRKYRDLGFVSDDTYGNKKGEVILELQ